MSSQLTSLVPVFYGSNCSTWSKAMTAFFMLQGLWGYVADTIPVPVVAAGPPLVTAADVALWNKNDEMARGNLTLCLSPAVQQAVTGNTSQILWDAIKDRYGVVSMPHIHKDFKEAISIRFNPNQQQPEWQRGGRGSSEGKGKGKQRDGAPQHSHIASVAAVAPLTTHKVLHIGSSGSSIRMESEASPIEKSSSFYPSVKKACTLTERMDVPATIQTVKMLEEHFADIDAQMRPRINAFMDKEYDSDFDVDMSQPPKGALPIIDFEALNSESINALGLQFGELTMDGGSDKENRAPTPSYVAPKDIPEAREIMAMWENPPFSKRLERKTSNKVIDDIYNSHQQYLADKEFGTLISPAGSCATTPEVEYLSGPPDDDEPPYDVLDWGSDDEEYVSSLSIAPYTKNCTVLLPSLKGFEDGACKTVVQSSVNYKADLYYVNTISFDLLKCQHNKYLSQCAKCKERTDNMWLLDSGASAHFTNNISDFINYTPIAKSDRLPVKTAAHTIYVEGTGTVLLKNYIANKLVTTRVNPVFYIPSMSTCLLSMGVFLQQGLRVLGNSQHINLLDNLKTIVQCKPLLPGQSLYC